MAKKENDEKVLNEFKKIRDGKARERILLERIEALNVIKECIWDTKELMKEKNLKPYQSDVINMAVVLFQEKMRGTQGKQIRGELQ